MRGFALSPYTHVTPHVLHIGQVSTSRLSLNAPPFLLKKAFFCLEASIAVQPARAMLDNMMALEGQNLSRIWTITDRHSMHCHFCYAMVVDEGGGYYEDVKDLVALEL